MNKKQKISLCIGIIAFAFVGFSSQMGNFYTANTIEDTIVYISRLIVRWIIVVVVTGGLIYIFKDKRDKEPEKDKKKPKN